MLRKELVNPQKSVPPDIYSVAEKFQPATEEGQSKHLLYSTLRAEATFSRYEMVSEK